MKAELIMVGTELLLGEIVDTNSSYLARCLADLGIDLYYVTKVGDNLSRIKGVVQQACQRADIVITGGGLGPTADDLTKEAVAAAVGRELVLDEAALKSIEKRFKDMGVEMSPNNRRQAYLPAGARALPNPRGTAPGVLLELEDGPAIIMLPGVPAEMEAIMEESVIPYLRKETAKAGSFIIHSRTLRFFGIGESSLEDRVKDIITNQSNPTVAPYASSGEVRLRLTAKAATREEADELIDPVEKQLLERVGKYFYGYGNEGMEKVVARLLFTTQQTVAVAESCTGGLISHKLTNVPGSSAYYMRGAVTYSNAAKQEVLGVSSDLLQEFGAVSEPVARAMAEGVRRWAKTDIGLAVTGIAGPGGGTPQKPVGLVYFGLSYAGGVTAEKRYFKGDRLQVKERAALTALDILRRYLQTLSVGPTSHV